jgi:hypothetical protein
MSKVQRIICRIKEDFKSFFIWQERNKSRGLEGMPFPILFIGTASMAFAHWGSLHILDRITPQYILLVHYFPVMPILVKLWITVATLGWAGMALCSGLLGSMYSQECVRRMKAKPGDRN